MKKTDILNFTVSLNPALKKRFLSAKKKQPIQSHTEYTRFLLDMALTELERQYDNLKTP